MTIIRFNNYYGKDFEAQVSEIQAEKVLKFMLKMFNEKVIKVKK